MLSPFIRRFFSFFVCFFFFLLIKQVYINYNKFIIIVRSIELSNKILIAQRRKKPKGVAIRKERDIEKELSKTKEECKFAILQIYPSHLFSFLFFLFHKSPISIFYALKKKKRNVIAPRRKRRRRRMLQRDQTDNKHNEQPDNYLRMQT